MTGTVKYRQTHKAEIKAQHALYYSENKAKQKARGAAYYQAHKVERKAKAAIYHAEHRVEAAKYRAANSMQIRSRKSRYEARLKLDAFAAYGGPKCVCCGETLMEGLTLDHINGDGAEHRKSVGAYGVNIYYWLKKNGYPSGFQVMCGTCNFAKGTSDHCPHEDLRIAWG
jgi:hypothetical protein